MIKTKTVETVEEFDESGRLLKRTVTERAETDDNPAQYVHTSSPDMPITCPNYWTDAWQAAASGNGVE